VESRLPRCSYMGYVEIMVASKQDIKDRVALEKYGKFFKDLPKSKQILINKKIGYLLRD
jgi:hypothetical protein